MSARMLKFPIPVEQGATSVAMRQGAVIRFAGVQREDEICLWAQVPDGDPELLEVRNFAVIGTGWDVPDPGIYIGTVFDGIFVWHVYEVTP